jgi:hypothetical protein
MVEKFYLEILEKQLQESDKVKPYREELEKRTHDFQDLIDMLFDPHHYFEQDKPKEDPTAAIEAGLKAGTEDPAAAIEQGLAGGTESDKGQRVFGLTPSTIREVEEECRLYTKLSAVSYFINSLVDKYSENNISPENIAKIQKEYGIDKSYKPFMQNFITDKEKKSSVDSYEQLSELKPKQVSKSSLQDKILVSLANGSKKFKDAFGETTDAKSLLKDTVMKGINAEIEEVTADPKFKIASTLNSFPKDSKTIIVHQLETQPYSPEQYEKFMKLGDSLQIKDFSKMFGKGGEFSALDSMSGGDLTATDVLDVLEQQGKYEEVMSGAFKAFSSKVAGINEALINAANKVFAGQTIGENPALQKTNEERHLMDVINDHVFYGDVSKKKITNLKFWQEAIENPNGPVAELQTQSQPVNQAGPAKTTTVPGAPKVGPQNEPKKPAIEPEDKLQKPAINTNALAQDKNNAIRQVTAMITMTTVMSFLSSFAKAFSESIGEQTEPELPALEEVFTEGIIDFVTKGIGGTVKALGGFLHNLTSAIPTDLNELNNKEAFDKVTKILLKQAKAGDFKSIMNQFNASKQSTSFFSKVFKPKTIQKNAGLIKPAVNKATMDTTQALNQFNETSLQKIMQNAYLSNADKGVRAAHKVANVVNKISTKVQGL